jgi:hypothetical protein
VRRRAIGGIALLSALALAPRVAAAGSPAPFEVSVTDRLSSSTVLVAGRTVSLVATAYPGDADPGCAVGDFDPQARFLATVALPAGVAFAPGQPAGEQVTVPAGVRSGRHDSFNVGWHVVVARPGLYSGTVTASGVTRAGTTCVASQRFRLVAVSGTPRVRVAGVFRSGEHDVVVASILLPGLPRVGRGVRAEAMADAVDDEHAIDADFSGKGVLDLVRLGREFPLAASEPGVTGDTGVACIDFDRARSRAIPYRLSFDWNRYKGFGARRRRGTLRVRSRVPGAAGRFCERQEGIAFG